MRRFKGKYSTRVLDFTCNYPVNIHVQLNNDQNNNSSFQQPVEVLVVSNDDKRILATDDSTDHDTTRRKKMTPDVIIDFGQNERFKKWLENHMGSTTLLHHIGDSDSDPEMPGLETYKD